MRLMRGAAGVVMAALVGCATAPHVDDDTGSPPPPSLTGNSGAATAKPGADDEPPTKPPDPEISAEAYRSVLEAEIKLQDGDVPGGIQLLREAVIHDPQSPYLHVRLAEAYLESGDAEQARASAQDALVINRKFVPAWRIVGSSWALAGDRKAARRAYNEALGVAPGDRDASMLLAQLLVDDGDLDGAENVIERLMQKEPGAVDGYIGLARVFAERGEVERAFKHVARALDRESTDVDALTLKLTLLWGLGKLDDALVVAKAIAAAAGDNPEVRRDLLTALSLAGKSDEATGLAHNWIDDDGSQDMRLLVADAYERAGDYPAAINALSERPSVRTAAEIARLQMASHNNAAAVLAVCPVVEQNADPRASQLAAASCARAMVRTKKAKDAGALLRKRVAALGGATPGMLDAETVVAKAGGLDTKTALADADKALADKPGDVDVVTVVSRMHEELGDVEKARAILDDALKARPKDADLLFALARHLDRQKQPLPAVEIVERLLDRGKAGIDELNFVAFTLAESSTRLDDAKKLAWRALVQDPLNGYVVDTLGWCQLLDGDADAAVATLKRADRLSPGEGEILFHLGAALERKGDKKAALETAARARALMDDDDPVRPRVEALVDKLKRAGA